MPEEFPFKQFSLEWVHCLYIKNCSISNNSVYPKYTIQNVKRVQFQTIQFSIRLNVQIFLFQAIQFSQRTLFNP